MTLARSVKLCRRIMADPNVAFTLRVRTHSKVHHDLCHLCAHSNTIVVTAYDDNQQGITQPGRVHIDIEVKHAGVVIFPRGVLWGSLLGATDSTEAKEHALYMVAYGPDKAKWTELQREWHLSHGEAIDLEREIRYCDENGNVKKGSR